MPGTGGIKKLRWGANHKGKRAGRRIIYYWFNLKNKLLMMYMYPKNVQEDLSPEQLKVLCKVVCTIHTHKRPHGVIEIKVKSENVRSQHKGRPLNFGRLKNGLFFSRPGDTGR
ncbi:MAG: hypothetical protein NTZ74_02255 [Chloroflexi bacterium]|nr:hypothetical protein [Chloroflexota bacterium]